MENQRTERKLAAILAADVVGYSRLMSHDEEGTLRLLKAHLGELVEPHIAAHRGRIVKRTGDGLLVDFASAVEAVRCAVAIQAGMADRNRATMDDSRVEFRIGINLGDVIIDGDDIYGDGVNIAARLEALAEPGGLCVSRVVRDQIRDKLPYAFEDMGEQSVKNIARPVRTYAMSAAAVASTQLVAPPAKFSPTRRRLNPQRAVIAASVTAVSASGSRPGGLGRKEIQRRLRSHRLRQRLRKSHPLTQALRRRGCRLSFCPLRTCRTIRTRNILPTESLTI